MIGMFATPARSAAVAIRCALPALLMLACAWPLTAAAQGYPEHSIRMVVPYAAGGSVDLLGRSIAEKMSVALGKSVIADNRVGANGTIAHEIVATAPPDGYTIGMSGTSPLVLAPWQIKNLPYDTTKDFAFLACPGTTPFVLDVSPSLPVKNIKELVAYAKAHPGKLNFGSAGPGTGTHLTAELFQVATGTRMTHVPYKGSSPALTDLMAGNLDLMFDYPVVVMPFVKAGKLKPLAVTGKGRLTAAPDIPAVGELGFPKAESSAWSAVFLPAKTPPEIAKRLGDAIAQAIVDPEMLQVTEKFGSVPLKELRDARLGEFVKTEMVRWRDVVQASGAKLE